MTNFSLPSDVLDIIKTIENEGFEAWCVGGCVRDILRGETPDDFDLTSNAPSEKIMELFEKVIPTGIKHGTVTVVKNNLPYEITRYRIDGEYLDSRRPDTIEFTGNIKEDLARRDFSVNAIAYHPERGLLDPFGGEIDIKNRLIKTVGNADKRFSEDALRIFRAIRFSAKLKFEIEEQTLISIIKNAKNLKAVSAERIRVELLKTLLTDEPQKLKILIDNGGLRDFGFCSCSDLNSLSSIPKDEILRFAALCILANVDVESCSDALRFSNLEKRRAKEFFILINEDNPTLPFVKSNCKILGFEGALEAANAWGIIHNTNADKLCQDIKIAQKNNEPYLSEHLEISGEDIKNLGFSGKQIGAIQSELLKLIRIDASLNSKDKLIKTAKEMKFL